MTRQTMIMFAVSLSFFFVTATTFTSLGFVLYTMIAELGWSQTAAGASFSLLGLSCGLSSPLPPLLMKWVGTRLTMTIGGLVLAAGFLLASLVHGIGPFFAAMALLGTGFSLIAPSPAVFLIATWMPERYSRLVGYFFMAGALGGVAGPLIVRTILGLTGSWRMHWAMMGVSALALALFLFATIRDAVAVESTEQVKHAGHAAAPAPAPSPWTVRQALSSSTFLMIALAMLVVQTVVTTIHSVLVAHVAGLGAGTAPGAWAMSMVALTGTVSKGITGRIAERYDPRRLMVGGLVLTAAAMAMLCLTATPAWAIASAFVFGIGWGFAWLTAHLLLIRYFGTGIAGSLVAMATMATTFAVLGPLSAGWVADASGSFVPVFAAFAAMLGMAALTTALFLHAPRRRDAMDPPPVDQPALAVAAE